MGAGSVALIVWNQTIQETSAHCRHGLAKRVDSGHGPLGWDGKLVVLAKGAESPGVSIWQRGSRKSEEDGRLTSGGESKSATPLTMGSADSPIPASICTSARGARQKTIPRAGARRMARAGGSWQSEGRRLGARRRQSDLWTRSSSDPQWTPHYQSLYVLCNICTRSIIHFRWPPCLAGQMSAWGRGNNKIILC